MARKPAIYADVCVKVMPKVKPKPGQPIRPDQALKAAREKEANDKRIVEEMRLRELERRKDIGVRLESDPGFYQAWRYDPQMQCMNRRERKALARKRRGKAEIRKTRRQKEQGVIAGLKCSKESYEERGQILEMMGFASYEAYLASPLWWRIRAEGMKRNGGKCMICQADAVVLHHHSYRRPVLDGTNMDALFPLCDQCHENLEMDGERKIPLSMVQRELRRILYANKNREHFEKKKKKTRAQRRAEKRQEREAKT